MTSVQGNTRQCQAWRERVYARHKSLASHLKKSHLRNAIKLSYVEANLWLIDQENKLKIGNSGLFCDCSDHELKDYAEAKSKNLHLQLIEAGNLYGSKLPEQQKTLCDYIREKVERTGIKFPLAESDYSNDEMIAALCRVCTPEWWRRKLRNTASRQYENYCRKAGFISISGDIYCSDYTLRRKTEQRAKNQRLLESLEAESSSGQVYTLAELAEKSVSNPINRRNELMTRIAGFESYVKERTYSDKKLQTDVPYVGVFLTLTAPSKYHAKIIRKTAADKRYAIPNKKFEGANPRECNDYLCTVWANIRSEWAKRDIHPFGFRMVEPHHDGTPHWHMVLFVPENRLIETCYVFHHYAMREDGDEAGAEEARTAIVYLDPAKGSAAGYCAKYISKNIDGFAIDADSYGREAVKSAIRISAWARTWGIRQFQQIGGPSVTIWREARRILSGDLTVDISAEAEPILKAADAGDWFTYTELMGGPICPRKERPIRPLMVEADDTNAYGEALELFKGLIAFGVPTITRIENWTVQPAGTASRRNSAGGWSASVNHFSTRPKAA